MSESLLRHRAFMRFWFARLAGTAANQMLMVAIGWQMYDLTGSAWDLGLVGLYQFVPALLFTLVAGHVADRWHRGRIVAFCMVAQALDVAVRITQAVQQLGGVCAHGGRVQPHAQALAVQGEGEQRGLGGLAGARAVAAARAQRKNRNVTSTNSGSKMAPLQPM